MDYIKTWKEIMFTPSDFFRRMPTTGGYVHPLIFAIVITTINILLSILFRYGIFIFGIRSSILTLGNMPDSGFNVSIFSDITEPFVISIVGTFIMALIFNLFSKVLGGTGSYEGTIRFMFYSSAPALLTWIPILDVVAGIYAIYLNVVGCMTVYNISMGKSMVLILLSFILFVSLFALLATFLGFNALLS
jgi:hypothetical protein